MANVFVSHRGSDAAPATRLADAIRSAGHIVWLDEWEIGIGDSIPERIDQGLGKADYVLVCFSNEGVTSPWMGREWFSTLARQLNGQGIKVLPVRLTGGGPPPILADLRFADLVANWDEGIERLLRAPMTAHVLDDPDRSRRERREHCRAARRPSAQGWV
jgi:hypothetical protein